MILILYDEIELFMIHYMQMQNMQGLISNDKNDIFQIIHDFILYDSGTVIHYILENM